MSVNNLPSKLPQVSAREPPKKSKFAQEVEFTKRLAEAEEKLTKYPDRVPLVLETYSDAKVINLTHRKFLVPSTTSVSQFMQTVRRRANLRPDQAMFLFVNNTLPPVTDTMGHLYSVHAANDRFLYIMCGTESTFGCDTITTTTE